MDTLRQFKQWFDQHRLKIREDYFRFLKFPSVSADPAYNSDVLACADWLMTYLREGSLQAELIQTSGNPIVYAEEMSAGSGKPTVLFYGHYDVQPVDPIELWTTPPFEPTERNGKIYARGAADDKGQILYACLGIIAWKKMGLPMPVNIKFCIEGEEEYGSNGLSQALPSLKEKFKADTLVIVDFDSKADGSPALTLGARGLVALEVTLTGSKGDLHSGSMGGIAYNPNRALVELLSKLWDENGKVAVPGFYDDITPASPEVFKNYSYSLDPQLASTEFGIHAIGGEKGKSLMEKNWLRPTLDINGMHGGYTGKGTKTVIPCKASAKLTGRLVSKQDPQKVCKAIASFLKQHCVPGMAIQVDILGGDEAFLSSADSKVAKAIAKAASEVVGMPCVNILAGGSIPVVAKMMHILETKIVGMGYGLATDGIHAPNEHFDMRRFEKGFLTVARAIECI